MKLVNEKALKLYAQLGFVRQKRLRKYYLSGNDAFRLKYRFCPRDEMRALLVGGLPVPAFAGKGSTEGAKTSAAEESAPEEKSRRKKGTQ